jgi:hypothetical protein
MRAYFGLLAAAPAVAVGALFALAEKREGEGRAPLVPEVLEARRRARALDFGDPIDEHTAHGPGEKARFCTETLASIEREG